MANSRRSAEKESFWRLVVDEHRRSGLTARDFCKKEGISQPSFYAWRRELNKRDAEPTSGVSQQQSLVPVTVVETVDDASSRDVESRSSLMEVVTPVGYMIRFHEEVEPQRLRDVLRVVVSCHEGASPC